MPEESRTKPLNLQDFQGDTRQGLLQFSRTEQGGLENCKAYLFSYELEFTLPTIQEKVYIISAIDN